MLKRNGKQSLALLLAAALLCTLVPTGGWLAQGGNASETRYAPASEGVTPTEEYVEPDIEGTKWVDPVRSAASAEGNLFENGDLEQGNDAGWQTYQSTKISTDAAYEGRCGLNLLGNGSWGALLEQKVDLEIGAVYTLSFWYKANSNGINWKLVRPDGSNVATNWVNQKQWTQVTLEFVADTATVTFNASGGGNGIAEDVYVDSITLKTVDSDDSGNLVRNPDFEEGTDGWKLGGKTAIVEGNAYSGTRAVRLEYNGAWGEALTQTVPVKPNTDYTVIFYTKRVSGGGAWSTFIKDTGTLADILASSGQPWFKHTTSDKWVENRFEFNSGDRNGVLLKFGPETADSGVFLLDGIFFAVSGTEPIDPEPPAGTTPPTMIAYSVLTNRPVTPDKNLLTDASFEKGTFGFDHAAITAVEDPTAPDGSRSLYFNTSTVKDEVKEIVWLTVEPDTEYIFSVWLKGAFISPENPAYNATVGIVDSKGTFLSMAEWVFLNGQRQIVPPSWDNQWHLRGIKFHSGSSTKVGICLQGSQSQLWIDDMALFVSGNGVKYVSPNMGGAVALKYDTAGSVCPPEDCLIPDPRLEGRETVDFWSAAQGFKNGFVSFVKDEAGYGTSLKYTGSGRQGAMSCVRWVDVKPNTDYTFSVNVKILKSGAGHLALMDDKLREKTDFMWVSFDDFDYDEENADNGWHKVIVSFNTKVYQRIGFAILDAGGEVLLDNLYLFESSKATGDRSLYLKAPTAAQLWAATAKSGDTARYTVNAVGEGLTYKWYYKDKGAADFTYTASYKSNTYSAPMTAARDGRQVYCVVTDKHGYSVQSRTVTLRMGTPFSVTQPSAQTVYAKQGATAKVALKATGDGLKYTWYVKNDGASKYTKSSITKATYSVEMTSKVHGRRVYCVVTDKFGNTYTTKTYLLRRQATITSQSATTRYAKWGATVSAKVTAVGDGLKYTWYVKNEGASKYSKSSVTKSTYSVTMGTKVKNRRVYCVVKDKYGKTVQSKTFIFRESVSIVTQPKSATVANKKTAKVTVKARGDGLKYTWYVKNAGSSKYSKSSVTKSTYSVTMTSKVNGRRVYCVVKDKYGKTVQTKTVILKKK